MGRSENRVATFSWSVYKIDQENERANPISNSQFPNFIRNSFVIRIIRVRFVFS